MLVAGKRFAWGRDEREEASGEERRGFFFFFLLPIPTEVEVFFLVYLLFVSVGPAHTIKQYD
jgi:hypothetical protein